MNQPRGDAVAHKMAELKARFAVKQRVELAALAQRVDSLSRGHADNDALQASYLQLHRLAGSAGTLGFPALGREARVLEQQLKPLALMPQPDSTDCQQVLDSDFCRRLTGLASLLEEPV